MSLGSHLEWESVLKSCVMMKWKQLFGKCQQSRCIIQGSYNGMDKGVG